MIDLVRLDTTRGVGGLSGPSQLLEQARSIGPAAGSGSAGADFSSVMTQLASDAVGSLQKAEATTIAALQDKATVQDVVESVMAAQRSLQTGIAIRDKVVAAYLEISRMQI